MATVTLSLEELQEYVVKRNMAYNEVAALKEKLRVASLRADSEVTSDLVEALRAVLPVISFAVGNLSPEAIRGWPHDALKTFAGRLAVLFAGDDIVASLALEFGNFAREAASYEEQRRGDR